MLRLEKGTINRVIYQVLSYFDPAKPWSIGAPQKGWNGKLMWKMGAATSANHFEAPPSASVFDRNALAAGFMVANSSSTEHLQNNNELIAAETMMMVKEHIIETVRPDPLHDGGWRLGRLDDADGDRIGYARA